MLDVRFSPHLEHVETVFQNPAKGYEIGWGDVLLNLIDPDEDCAFWLNELRLYSPRPAEQEADLETRLLLDGVPYSTISPQFLFIIVALGVGRLFYGNIISGIILYCIFSSSLTERIIRISANLSSYIIMKASDSSRSS